MVSEKMAYKSDYWKIKREDDSHLAFQSFYNLDWLPLCYEDKDRMSWQAWIYLDCDEGDRWNERMWGLIR